MNIYYFEGSTYAKSVLLFLKETFPQFNFIAFETFKELDPKISRWILLSPTPDNKALDLINNIDAKFKLILLLDWNHSGFTEDTYKLLKSKKMYRIFSPWKLQGHKFTSTESLHGHMMKQKITIKNLNEKDHFFCSQPLKEDRPKLGFDQFDLMREVVKSINSGHLFIKRHPRELEPLPKDLDQNPIIKIWNGTIEDALSEFKNWYGLNSMPLYDARTLKHNVTFIKLDVNKICK